MQRYWYIKLYEPKTLYVC